MTFKIFFDGASRSNPGEAGAGWLVLDHNGSIISKGFEYLGVKTNNQAEYIGLLRALQTIVQLDIGSDELITISGDSNLIIQQLTGKFKVKSENLKELYQRVKTIINKFNNIEFKHVKREFNKEADQLANIAIDTKKTNVNFIE